MKLMSQKSNKMHINKKTFYLKTYPKSSVQIHHKIYGNNCQVKSSVKEDYSLNVIIVQNQMSTHSDFSIIYNFVSFVFRINQDIQQ